MTLPLVVLAVMSLFAGFLGVPHSLGGSDRFARYLDPVFAPGEAQVLAEQANADQLAAGKKEGEQTNPTEYGFMGLSIAAAIAGWLLAGRFYRQADKGFVEPIQAVAPPVYNTLLNKYYVHEGYDYVFTGRRKLGGVRLGAMGLGEACSWFDANVIEPGTGQIGRAHV